MKTAASSQFCLRLSTYLVYSQECCQPFLQNLSSARSFQKFQSVFWVKVSSQLATAHTPTPLCWLLSQLAVFLRRHSIFLGSQDLLGSPLYLWLPYHGSVHCPLRGSWPNFPAFPLKSQWNPPWPHNSCIPQSTKTSITWMTPMSTVSGNKREVKESQWTNSLEGHRDSLKWGLMFLCP